MAAGDDEAWLTELETVMSETGALTEIEAAESMTARRMRMADRAEAATSETAQLPKSIAKEDLSWLAATRFRTASLKKRQPAADEDMGWLELRKAWRQRRRLLLWF